MAKHPNPATERRWRQAVRRWERSSETVRDFCLRHGLCESSFYFWKRELRQRDAQRRAGRGGPSSRRQAPTFVPVQVEAAGGATAAAADDAADVAVEVLLGDGRVVRVRPGFDAATLRQVLALLEGRPC